MKGRKRRIGGSGQAGLFDVRRCQSARPLRRAAKRAAESGGELIVVHVVATDCGLLEIGRDESRELDGSLQAPARDRLRVVLLRPGNGRRKQNRSSVLRLKYEGKSSR